MAEAVANAPERYALALQTSSEACLSYPLVSFLRASAILWLVEGPHGEIRNGLLGPSAGRDHAPAASTAVVLFGSVLHAAGGDLPVGAFATRMLAACSLSPAYMGLTEPLHQAWDMDALTAELRGQAPKGVALVSGDGFSGTVSAYRTEAGVVEGFDVLLPAGLPEAGSVSAVADAAVEANAQEIGIDVHHGLVDGFVREGGELSREPWLRVFGPSLHSGLPEKLDGDAELRGVRPFQHLVATFPGAVGQT
ncbi:DUF6177 family protein [Paenarthrobacter sp. NPDC018779]|uniref:DUF6177 family protein n=1 Tax=Paenarthrobacter sp. NPDC018779 TaxID=3364375 RepID=UPI0037CBDAED